MFRKYHFTVLLKDRISYSELTVLHKLYVFIPPSGPARTLPHAILWTCDTMLTGSTLSSLFMLITKLAYCRSYDGASRQPGPHQPLHVPTIAPPHWAPWRYPHHTETVQTEAETKEGVQRR